jgi:hypothetical protein
MSERERDVLVESCVTAFRERDPEGRLVPPATWWDLSPEALDELYERQVLAREIERALDPQGLSGTARAALERIAG